MSFGKGGGTQITTAEMTPEQRQQIATQTDFFKNTIAPMYQQAVQGAHDIYNQTLPGVTPIVGLGLTFDQVFNCYLTGNINGTGTAGGFKQWQLTNTSGNTGFIKEPDGYVLFSYLDAFYARPL